MLSTVFQFQTKPSFFESIVVRPIGTLLITRQDANEIWEIDPATGTGKCVVTIPDVASLTGLTEVSPDVYAVGAGIYRLENHEGTVPGSYSIWTIDFTSSMPEPEVKMAGRTPDIGQANGISAWDQETILIADSHYGKVYRFNLSNGHYSVCLEDDSLNDAPNAPIKMSVNGIKVHQFEGIKYVYYTNTTRMLFCRVPVDDNIRPAGPVEVLTTGFIPERIAVGTMFEALPSATLPSSIVDPTSLPPPIAGFVPDDFCFAEDGTAYVTTHPTNMVVKIPRTGAGAVIAGGFASLEVGSPTACAIGKSEKDKDVLYVVTAGGNVVPIKGQTEPARVVTIKIGS